MAIDTGFASLRVAVPAGQGSDLVALAPATSLLPTAPLSVTGGQLRRLRLALRTVEDLADLASHIDVTPAAALERAYRTAEAERSWVDRALGLDAAGILDAAEDARWHCTPHGLILGRACRQCRRDALGLDESLPLGLERNFDPDPVRPAFMAWEDLVTVADAIDHDLLSDDVVRQDGVAGIDPDGAGRASLGAVAGRSAR
jgi:hypothetical protein